MISMLRSFVFPPVANCAAFNIGRQVQLGNKKLNNTKKNKPPTNEIGGFYDLQEPNVESNERQIINSRQCLRYIWQDERATQRRRISR